MAVQQADAKTAEEARQANQKWLKALTVSVDAVMECYAVADKDGFEGVLLPTVQGLVCDTLPLRRAYFTHFLEKKPIGKIDEERVQILNPTPGSRVLNYMGHYTFSLMGPDGKRSDVPARFTFTYVETPRGWVIAHHHSSAMPEGGAAKANNDDHGCCCGGHGSCCG